MWRLDWGKTRRFPIGLGNGSGAHAPDEYYLIESSDPKVQGFDGAVSPTLSPLTVN